MGTAPDRAAGVLLGAATGDALGVPYEYGSRPLDGEPAMLGGGLGGYAPGQWSDDTEMACVVARVAATGADLRSEPALDAVAGGFLEWFATGPPDIGVQTRAVLSRVRPGPGAAARLRAAAADVHRRTGRSAGNGSLMRTAPVALAHLGDPDAIVAAAHAVSALTHHDPVAGEACAVWCLAIDHAVRTGELDLRPGLARIDPQWTTYVDGAGYRPPSAYGRDNGWVVAALCGAWSAVHRAASFEDGVVAAVRGGGDTDTVAAITGALLGARFGAGTVPARWRRVLHGWPGLRARDLVRLGVLAARGDDHAGWPSFPVDPSHAATPRGVVPHPDDPGVLLGAAGALRPGVADAVVSLCRLGTDQAPLSGVDAGDHVEVWLVDRDDANLDLPRVIADAASAVRDLRVEGRTVLLHCVWAQSRTPVVAAAYGALITGDPPREVLDRVVAVLPDARPRAELVAALG